MGVILIVGDGQVVFRALLKAVMKDSSMQRRRISGMLDVILEEMFEIGFWNQAALYKMGSRAAQPLGQCSPLCADFMEFDLVRWI